MKLVMLLPSLVFLAMVTVSAHLCASTIAEAKLSADGTPVCLSGAVLNLAQTDLFYIETEERTCAIRVVRPNHRLQTGYAADIVGVVRTNSDGERYVDAQSAERIGGNSIFVKPLVCTTRWIGGGSCHYDSGTGAGDRAVFAGKGLNNVGILVTLAGTVTYVDKQSGFAYIDDGGDVSDGNSLGPRHTSVPGIRVMMPDGTSMRSVGTQMILNAVVCKTTVSGSSVRALIPRSYTGEMQYVPPGTFLMGNTEVGDDWIALQGEGYQYTDDELPSHYVTLTQGYWLGTYEVTRGEYRQFVNVGGYNNPDYWSPEGWAWKTSLQWSEPRYWAPAANWGTPPGPFAQGEMHPVCGVSYYEAQAFCKWAGCRLPTEAEWERAARWDGTARIYPWGNDVRSNMCNDYGDSRHQGYQTAPVGSYPNGISPVGCHDMGGNLWEWCKDWCPRASYDLPVGPVTDPQGPSSGTIRAIRGGSWLYGTMDARCASRFRASPGNITGYYDIGFRTAR